MRIIDLSTDPSQPIPRPPLGDQPIDAVRSVLAAVRERGDAALFELTERFDGVRLQSFRVPQSEIRDAFDGSSVDLITTMQEAADRIREFAEMQALRPWEKEIGGGKVGERVFPVPRAGLYVPGGRAPYPSTVLMTAIPAAVAGVPEIALCVPPSRDGSTPPITLAAAKIAGVTEIYRLGGAQAIAAMAYGTESIPRVQVIVGPGNIFVALAKQEVSGLVGIDSVAGPSEIAIVTDGSLNPEIAAIDLIAQAEHGPNGSFILATWRPGYLDEVARSLEATLERIGASEELRAALALGCVGVQVADLGQAVDAIDTFAPEHLQIVFEGAGDQVDRFRSAGAIFVGESSPVCLGDYLAGTNHVLPTSGAGRWASGLRTSHFQRTAAVVEYGHDALEATTGHIERLAAAENLPNHARAVRARVIGLERW
jgi:histidinol dehydrogenase